MKRRDLKPETYFRYACNRRQLYVVAVLGEHNSAKDVCQSNPNEASTDWDLDVIVEERRS